ncbi:MAG TPA: hypothetical protein VH482_29350 [Thermomicrobiales bacterium]
MRKLPLLVPIAVVVVCAALFAQGGTAQLVPTPMPPRIYTPTPAVVQLTPVLGDGATFASTWKIEFTKRPAYAIVDSYGSREGVAIPESTPRAGVVYVVVEVTATNLTPVPATVGPMANLYLFDDHGRTYAFDLAAYIDWVNNHRATAPAIWNPGVPYDVEMVFPAPAGVHPVGLVGRDGTGRIGFPADGTPTS